MGNIFYKRLNSLRTAITLSFQIAARIFYLPQKTFGNWSAAKCLSGNNLPNVRQFGSSFTCIEYNGDSYLALSSNLNVFISKDGLEWKMITQIEYKITKEEYIKT